MSHVTTDIPEAPVQRLAYNLGVEDVSLMSGEMMYSPGVYLIFLNGACRLAAVCFFVRIRTGRVNVAPDQMATKILFQVCVEQTLHIGALKQILVLL